MACSGFDFCVSWALFKEGHSMLIISAAEFEVLPLKEKGGHPYSFASIGVGPLEAAAQSEALLQSQDLAELRAEGVFFVGTCGTFEPFQGVSLVTTNEVHWLPICERMKLSYQVKGTCQVLKEAQWAYSALPCAKVLCTPTIALTNEIHPDVRSRLGLGGLMVENLELYPFLQAASRLQIPVKVILAVTNAVGSHGHEQWKANFREAAQRTAEFLS